MHVSLATKSGVVVSWEPWASFAAMLRASPADSGPGGSLLGSKCQSRHVGASTNRLVGTAGWLEGKKQLAERSESPVAQLLSIIMDEARARQWDLVGYRHLLGLL